MAEGLNFTWATWLVDAAPTFDHFVTLELDKYDACMATGAVCALPRLLAIGVYDHHIMDYMDVFPQHFFCIVDNVGWCEAEGWVWGVLSTYIQTDIHISIRTYLVTSHTFFTTTGFSGAELDQGDGHCVWLYWHAARRLGAV